MPQSMHLPKFTLTPVPDSFYSPMGKSGVKCDMARSKTESFQSANCECCVFVRLCCSILWHLGKNLVQFCIAFESSENNRTLADWNGLNMRERLREKLLLFMILCKNSIPYRAFVKANHKDLRSKALFGPFFLIPGRFAAGRNLWPKMTKSLLFAPVKHHSLTEAQKKKSLLCPKM